MNEKIKGFKGFSVGVIITSILLGIALIAFPNQCIGYLSLFIGISMIVVGVTAVINYAIDKLSTFSLVLGVIVAICGIIVCVKYQAIVNIVITILGICMLASGIGHLATSIRVLVLKSWSAWVTLALSIAEIVFGIIAMTNSKDTGDTIVRLLGASLIVLSVLSTITLIQFINLTKKVKQQVDSQSDIIVEATEEK